MTATLASNAWGKWKALVYNKPPESLFQRSFARNGRKPFPHKATQPFLGL